MQTLWQDLRYGVRMLGRSPGFTLVAALSLALGIGVNTTIFSFVNAVLLRPLPVPESERLVRLYDGLSASYPIYTQYRDASRDVVELAAYSQRPLSLNAGGETERVWGEIVTGNYFDVLGLRPVWGRTFLPEEDRTPGTHPVIVISENLWRRKFNSDPNIINQSLVLNNNPVTVIGVMPQLFIGTDIVSPSDVWVPMMMEPLAKPGSQSLTSVDDHWLEIIGRLKHGVAHERAAAVVETVARRIQQERAERNPEFTLPPEMRAVLVPAQGVMIPPHAHSSVLLVVGLLMAVVSMVLLVACANVANMLLARATVRRREIAVRLALGAGKWRIVRQLLTESVLLALIGGALGLLLAAWSSDVLLGLFPPDGPFATLDVSPDARVFAYTLLLSMATGLVFGLAPALQSSQPDLIPALKDEMMVFARGRSRFSLRNLLVITQVAVSLVLLIGAGLLIRNLRNTQTAEPGFPINDGLMMSFDLALNGYDKERGEAFHQQLLERTGALAGVRSASLALHVPLGGAASISPLYVEGEPIEQMSLEDESQMLFHNTVGLRYFETMGIPLRRGRDFNAGDTAHSPEVIIVNETLARRIAPDGDAVGRRIRTDTRGEYLEVIGVVRDIKYRQLAERPRFAAYRALAQNYHLGMTLHVRTAGDPTAVIASVRQVVRELDPNLPLYNVKTLAQHMQQPLAAAQLFATLSSAFGLLALLLATVGIYGVMAYMVGGRTREIGIRMALGASKRDVLRLLLSEGLTMVAIGIGVGLAISLIITRVLASVLYGVSPTDPATFASVSLLLAAVTLLACYLPARRALQADPMAALRYE